MSPKPAWRDTLGAYRWHHPVVAERPGYTPKASLAYFDAAVRECRAA